MNWWIEDVRKTRAWRRKPTWECRPLVAGAWLGPLPRPRRRRQNSGREFRRRLFARRPDSRLEAAAVGRSGWGWRKLVPPTTEAVGSWILIGGCLGPLWNIGNHFCSQRSLWSTSHYLLTHSFRNYPLLRLNLIGRSLLLLYFTQFIFIFYSTNFSVSNYLLSFTYSHT